MRTFTSSDIDPSIKKLIYPADYTEEEFLDGVKLINMKNIPAEEGDFSEILRIKQGELESFKGFKLAQINRTTLVPSSIKAWHLHYKQDEIWYVSPQDHLLAGLWDVRRKSRTSGKTIVCEVTSEIWKILLHKSLRYVKVFKVSNKPVELYVFVNKQFKILHHDEKRIPWDSLGKEFWRPKRD